jgi:hypothetical protein
LRLSSICRSSWKNRRCVETFCDGDRFKIFKAYFDLCFRYSSTYCTFSSFSGKKLFFYNTKASAGLVIQKLSSISSIGDEAIQLKILQALLALLSTQNIHGKELSMVGVVILSDIEIDYCHLLSTSEYKTSLGEWFSCSYSKTVVDHAI